MEVCLRVGVVHPRRALLAGESLIWSETRTPPRQTQGQRIDWQPAGSLGAPSLAASSDRSSPRRHESGARGARLGRRSCGGSDHARSVAGLSEGTASGPDREISFAPAAAAAWGMRGAPQSREEVRSSVLAAGAGTSTLAVRTNDRRLAPRRPCDASCHIVLAAVSTLATVTVGASSRSPLVAKCLGRPGGRELVRKNGQGARDGLVAHFRS
jgi:hypothetical protein